VPSQSSERAQRKQRSRRFHLAFGRWASTRIRRAAPAQRRSRAFWTQAIPHIADSQCRGADFTFTSSTYTQFLDQAAILSWSAPPGAQCTAGGGSPGDGWAGSVANAGSQSVTEGAAGLGDVRTELFDQRRTPRQWVAVRWYPPVPTANLTVSSSFRWTTRPVVLTWSANVSPCTLSGGSLSATGLPASGSTTTTQSTAGDVAYTLTCGSATSNVGVTYVTPSETLQANSTDHF